MKSSFARNFFMAASVLVATLTLPLSQTFAQNAVAHDNGDGGVIAMVDQRTNHDVSPTIVGSGNAGGDGDDPPTDPPEVDKDAEDKAFAVDEPTEDRPYYYIKYDSTTYAANPDRQPIEQSLPKADGDNSGKIIVYNYVDLRDRYSALQQRVVNQSLLQLAKASDRDLMLVDVVAYDENGLGVYHADAALAVENNKLGPEGSGLPVDFNNPQFMIPPYAVVAGPDLNDPDSGVNEYFDFALMVVNGKTVTSNEVLNANAQSFHNRMKIVVGANNAALAQNVDQNNNPVVNTTSADAQVGLDTPEMPQP